MADSIEPGWITRIRFTPLSELVRGDVNGRLHWRHVIASAELPAPIAQLVLRITKRTRLWNKERRAVAEELIAHFHDGLAAGESSQALIDSFGDERPTARLIRRATKRNRSLIWHAWNFSLRGLGVILLIYAIFFIRFFLSRSTVKVDYLAELNVPNKAVPEPDRAWPLYRRAMLALNVAPIKKDKLLTGLVKPGGDGEGTPFLELTPADAQWSQLTHWLDAHADGLQLAREAAAKPAMGFILGPDGSENDPELGWNFVRNAKTFVDANSNRTLSDSTLMVLLPALNSLRMVATVLQADARYAQSQHDSARAIADIDAILGIAGHQRDPIIVTRLVSIGIYDLAFKQIESALRKDALSFNDKQLIHLAHRVSSVGGDTASSLIDMSGERVVFRDIMQRIYSDDGHGNGILTFAGAKALPMIRGMSNTADRDSIQVAMTLAIVGVTSPLSSRSDVVEEYDREMALLGAMFAHRLADPRSDELRHQYEKQIEEIWSTPLLRMRYLPLTLFTPALTRTAVTAERLLGHRDGIEIGLALQVFRQQQGHYPQTLAELSPRYLPQLPTDRITGGPLKYRLVDGRPVVYSVGDNRKDDGGRAPIGTDKEPDPKLAARWFLVSAERHAPADGDWVLFDLRPAAPTIPPGN